jgi:hypothetical protein
VRPHQPSTSDACGVRPRFGFADERRSKRKDQDLRPPTRISREANYFDYIVDWGQNGVPNPDPVRFNTTGNITGVPRTLKATMGFKF